jgi:hypothetical protein
MNNIYFNPRFRLMLVVSSALLMTACAGNPNKPTAASNSPEVQQMLQEWQTLKPGIERMLSIEEEMNLLLGQLGRLNEALDQNDGGERQVAASPVYTESSYVASAPTASHAAPITSAAPEIETTVPTSQPTPLAALPVETAAVPQVVEDAQVSQDNWSQTPSNAQYAVQVASIPDKSQLPVVWQELYTKNPNLLGDLQPNFQHAWVNNKDYYRLKLGGFATQTEAQARCRQLKAAGVTCLVSDYTSSDFAQLTNAQLTAARN